MDAVKALAAEVRASRLPSPKVRRRIRERAGVSLRKVGQALEVHPATVLRWEQGITEPDWAHATAYRRCLDELEKAAG